MRIGFITAGAAGMYCGSCMRDNTLVTALRELGSDAVLVPTFTPIRTDELDVSEGRVFYGGINVYLEQKSWFFRHTPRFIDWLFNRRWLLKFATKRAVNTDYADLAELTVSMLKGPTGHQKKELDRLVDWLETEVRPEVLILTNALLSGLVPTVAERLKIPIYTTLQGDDIYLDALPTDARNRCLAEIRRNDQHTTGYLATCTAYADAMAPYFGIDRAKIHVVYPGLNLKGHGGPRPDRSPEPPTLGYFARICPEKGFHNLIAAYRELRSRPDAPRVRLKVAGWLGDQHKAFFAQQVQTLTNAGLLADFEHVECPDHMSKVNFFQSIDVLSVPTTYREPKGLFVLEAWANGVPVVQPRHGSFPELIAATGGGLLVEPGETRTLANALLDLLTDWPRARAMGRQAQTVVQERFSARAMAEATLAIMKTGIGSGK